MNDPLKRLAAVAGLFAGPFYVALIIVLGALEPGFSHRTSLMSMLGGVPGLRGLSFNLGVAVTGALLIVFALGLRRQLPQKRARDIWYGLLTIGGAGLIGAGYFHCNEGCKNILAEPDLVGRLHIVTSLLGGLGAGLSLFFAWAVMRRSEAWSGFAKPTLAAAILANLPGVVFWSTILTGIRLHGIEGLIQRMGFIVVLIWIGFAAVKLWQLNPAPVDDR